MTCEACSGEASPFLQVSGVWYYRCHACGLTQLPRDADEASTAEIYGDDYFYGGGAGYPNYPAESAILREHGRWYARTFSRFIAAGRLLDVGGAAGYIAQGFRDFGWRPTVRDPNERMLSIADSLGEQTSAGTLETFTAAQRFDLVVMIQVIEHLYDLKKAVTAAAAATNPGGYLLVETWNGESLIARVLKTQWHQYSPPSVRRVFSPGSLGRALAEYGYRRVAIGRPQKWISGSHAKSLLLYKAAGANAVIRMASAAVRLVPDTLRLPYPAEDLFWALYRLD
jgi:SAM-dependent methyltransferase